jgi:hypothetical protein
MDTTAVPPGIYRISVAAISNAKPDSDNDEPGSIGSQRQYLTGGEPHVTIRPPNAHPDPDQEVSRRFSDELDLFCRSPALLVAT